MRPPRLTEETVRQQLEALPGWEFRDDRLHRRFRFADFSEAFAFMTRSAMVAEQLDHHPDWSNVYNRVEVMLFTHDQGGVTELDLRLAEAMSRFAA